MKKYGMTDDSQELLFEYAAGVLDEARRFMIDAHMQMSEHCKKDVELCEDLGGYLLVKDCGQAKMANDARDKMMAMLDKEVCQESKVCDDAQGQCMYTVAMLKSLGLSGELIEYLEQSCRSGCHPSGWSKWNKKIKFMPVDAACSQSKIRLVRIAAGTQVPKHSHNGDEMTLVIKGHLADEYGEYGPGDLVVRQDGEMHAPKVSDEEDFICLSLTYHPVKMKCMFRRVFNIFHRF